MRCPFRFRRFPEAVSRCMSGAAWIQVPTSARLQTWWHTPEKRPRWSVGQLQAKSPGFFYCSFETDIRAGMPHLCANDQRK
jgi:hypothetical protein